MLVESIADMRSMKTWDQRYSADEHTKAITKLLGDISIEYSGQSPKVSGGPPRYHSKDIRVQPRNVRDCKLLRRPPTR